MASKRSRPQELPQEIVCEILLNLRVKQLCKFRSVCKSWRSLIYSPDFQIEHYRRSRKNRLLLVTRKAAGKTYFSTYNKEEETPVNKYFERIEISQNQLTNEVVQCLGWVCIESNDRRIILCSPSTEDQTALPPPPSLGLHVCMGLGYAASTKEFKVVRFVIDYMNQYCCDVFTLGGSDWRQARSAPPYPVTSGRAPFLHGALHLLPNTKYDIPDHNMYIVAFNVETEDYKPIPLPKCYNKASLTELEGLLCLVIVEQYRGIKMLELEIWLLKDYNKRDWQKGYNIDFSSIDLYLGWELYARWAQPIAIMSDGTILMNVFGRNYELCILGYDPEKNTVTQKKGDNCSAISYVESFIDLGMVPRKSVDMWWLTATNWRSV